MRWWSGSVAFHDVKLQTWICCGVRWQSRHMCSGLQRLRCWAAFNFRCRTRAAGRLSANESKVLYFQTCAGLRFSLEHMTAIQHSLTPERSIHHLNINGLLFFGGLTKRCSWVQIHPKVSTTNHIPKCAAQPGSSRFRHATHETSLGSHQMCKSLNCSGPRGRNTKGHISSDALELIITAHRVENWTSSVFSVCVINSVICILCFSTTASSLCCKATLVGPRLMQPQNVNNASEMCPFFLLLLLLHRQRRAFGRDEEREKQNEQWRSP